MATLIDGKAKAAELRSRLTEEVARLGLDHDLVPALAVVLVGEDPASEVYVRNKGRQTIECGMRSIEHKLDTDTDESTLLRLIETLNADDSVHGILVQLPLPKQIDEARVLDSIRFDKDVDGFHLTNVGKLSTGADGVVPCTPLGCLLLLRGALGSLSGLDAVVVGRSNIVGKPMASLLLGESCTVTIAHSRTRNLAEVCRRADILVAAVGRPAMLGAEYIKPGAAVVDVGINRIEGPGGKMRLVGDVDFAAAQPIAGYITPVPGGVGPMTIACLLYNTVRQACRQRGIEPPVLDSV